MFSSFIRRCTLALFASLTLASGTTEAFRVDITDVSDFEGDFGTKSFLFRVSIPDPISSPETIRIRITALFGTPGPSCTGDVDFILPASLVVVTIFPDTPVTLGVTVCGDKRVESTDGFLLNVERDRPDLNCQVAFSTFCQGTGFIVDDDAPVQINDISVNEPMNRLGLGRATFTVSLNPVLQTATAVGFSTTSGSAIGGTSCGGDTDYLSDFGIVSIPARVPSVEISIPICFDTLEERPETFFVHLSSNIPIRDAVGQATIRDQGTAPVGEFALTPGDAEVQVGEPVSYTVNWIVPDGRVWRDLDTIDFRIRGGRTALWVRWSEAGNTFQLCERRGGDRDDGDEEKDVQSFKHEHRLRCGPGATPGSAGVLETPLARLHLDETSVVGSGPIGRSVALRLALSFRRKAAHHRYGVELAAVDDFGNRDAFFRLGTVSVRRQRFSQ